MEDSKWCATYFCSLIDRAKSSKCSFAKGTRIIVAPIDIEAINHIHLLLCQVKIKKAPILHHPAVGAALADGNGVALHGLAQHDLGRRLLVLFRQSGNHSIFKQHVFGCCHI